MNSRGNKYEFFCVLILVLLVSAKGGGWQEKFLFFKKLRLYSFKLLLQF